MRSTTVWCIWWAIAVLLVVVPAHAACTNPTPQNLNTNLGPFTIQDGDPASGSATYGAGICIYVITSSVPTATLRAKLTNYQLGKNNDRLTFYDGNSANTPLLSTVMNVPPFPNTGYVESTGPAMTIVLSTDNFAHIGGFIIGMSALTTRAHANPVQWVNTTSGTNDGYGNYYFSEPLNFGNNAYVRNTTRSWYFTLLPNQGSLRFTFYVDVTMFTPGTYVEAYAGANTSAPLLSRVGFNSFRTFVFSSSPVTLVRFVSPPGDNVNYQGLQFAVVSYPNPFHCSGRQVVNTSTSVFGYSEPAAVYQSGSYASGATCEWLFQSPPGTSIIFFINTYYMTNLDLGALVVYDGDSVDDPVIWRGYQIYPTNGVGNITTRGQRMLVRFTSAPYQPTTSDGFIFYISSQQTPVFCANNSVINVNANTALFASGTKIANPAPQWKIQPYQPNWKCSYILDPGAQSTFVEASYLNLNPGDAVSVYSLAPNNATTYVGAFTGTTIPTSHRFNIASGRVMVVFTSGSIGGNGFGWELNYQYFTYPGVCSGLSNLNTNGGNPVGFAMPNQVGFSFYPAGTSCSVRITSPSQYIAMKLFWYDLRMGDYLRVYDGSNANAPSIGNFTGVFTVENWLYSSGTRLYLTFNSPAGGAYVNNTGFYAEFTQISTNSNPAGYCSGSGTNQNMNSGSSEVNLDTNVNDFFGHARGISCRWMFTRTDWTTTSLGFYVRIDCMDTTIGDSVFVYDGPDENSPIIYSNVDGVGSFYSYDSQPATNSANLLIVYSPGQNYIPNLSRAKFNIKPFYPQSYAVAPYWCNGMQHLTGFVDIYDSLNYVSATTSHQISYLPGMRCQWLIDYTQPPNVPNPSFAIDMNFLIGQDGLFYPGEASWAVYDGPSNMSPVIFTEANQTFSAFSSGPVMYIEFNTSSSVQLHRGWGMALKFRRIQRSDACHGHVDMYMPDIYTIASYSSWNTAQFGNFPAARTCSWTLHGGAGMTFVVTDVQNAMDVAAGEVVNIYDGDSNAAPLILTVTYGTYLRPAYRTSGNKLHVEYSKPTNAISKGFRMRTDQLYVMPTPCATGYQRIFLSDAFTYFYGSGMEPFFTSEYGVDWESVNRAYPMAPNTDCTLQFELPFGTRVAIYEWSYIPDGFFEITVETYQGTRVLLSNTTGYYTTIQDVAWGKTIYIRIHTGALVTADTVWIVKFTTTWYPDVVPIEARPRNAVNCQDNSYPVVATPSDYAPYQNCNVLRYVRIVPGTATNNVTMNFTNLQYVTNRLQIDGMVARRAFEFDNLLTVRELFTTDLRVDDFVLPSLKTAFNINMNIGSGNRIAFPKLEVLWTLIMDQALNFVRLEFDSLIYADSTSIRNSELALTTIQMPVLTGIREMYLLNNDKLETLNMTKLSRLRRLSLCQNVIEVLDFPNFSEAIGVFTVDSIAGLTTINIPRVAMIRDFWLNNLRQLAQIDMGNVSYIHLELYSDTSHMAVFSGPKLQQMGALTINNDGYLTSVDFPVMTYAASIALGLTALTTLSLPSLVSIPRGVVLQAMPSLSVLDICALEYCGNVTVSSCPALSCPETQLLFYDAGSQSVVANPPACNAGLLGSFGCRGFVNQPVDIATCGYNLACIQQAIDRSYADKSGRVTIPPGTYTGCGIAPLSGNGKIITLMGAGQGATVIDCQGVGRAIVLSDNEPPAFTVSDLTLKNGAATTGGLVLITAGAPTFRRVTFLNGQALMAGGAVALSAGASPLFDTCNFTSNWADSGAALAVKASAVAVQNCFFVGNSAGTQAGAVLVLGASGGVNIATSVFSGNRAPQGGAVFSDSTMTISACNMTGNVAAQFGGAAALVPADPGAGTWTNISGSVFESNSATTGGALYGFSANLELTGVALRRNTASEDGGGLSAQCSPSYRILRGIKDTCEVYVIVSDTTISGNTAADAGGGVHVLDSRFYGTRNSVNSNRAGGCGGGVYTSSSRLGLTASTVGLNEAQRNGGGVYCEPYTGSCDVSSSTFTSNTADVAGGGMFLCTASCPNVTHSGEVISNGPLPPISTANTFTANSVGAEGYGSDIGSDPAQLTYIEAPLAQAISGRSLSSTGNVVVRVADSYGSVVTTSRSILALSLEVLGMDGSSQAARIKVGGSRTALSESGYATFTAATLIAQDISYLNGSFVRVIARLSDTVFVESDVVLTPCAPGQGRTVGQPVVCDMCAAGMIGSSDTDYVCTACLPGSYAGSAGASVCTLCAVDTFAPAAGAAACQPCASGSGADAPGSTQCTASDAIIGSNVLYPAVGASVGVCILILVGGACLWRLARRKTMQRYYLDADTTIRASGAEETPLMKSVKKIIGASSTTRAGGGMFADVYKAKHETRWIALKIIKKEMNNNIEAQMEFRREAVALSRLLEQKCRGIVELVFFLERNPMCVAMEFCNNGTLKRMLPSRTLALYDKVRIACEAAAAMSVVHSCNIVHLDLKTDNLLLDDSMHIKLADFGISRILDSTASLMTGLESMSSNPVFNNGDKDPAPGTSPNAFPTMLDTHFGTMAGSPVFNTMAGGGGSPQLGSISGGSPHHSPHNSSGGPIGVSDAFTPQYVDPLRLLDPTNQSDEFLRASDVYSFAVVMWAVFAQEEPYSGQAPEALMKEIKGNPLMRPRDLPNGHTEYDRIMRSCWHRDPGARPSFQAVLTALLAVMKNEFGAQLAAGYLSESAAAAIGVTALDTLSSVQYASPNFALSASGNSSAPPPPPSVSASAAAVASTGPYNSATPPPIPPR